jgi:uncharacterized membrane protein YkvA (DUF1232 family)
MGQARERRVTIELNARERRLYDRLRAQVVRTEPGQGSGLRDLILLVPDLFVLLVRLIRDERVPAGGKAIALLGVAYLLSPFDLIPDLLLGPIGLADDLLVLAACCSRIVNYVHPDVVRSHWSGQGDVLDVIQRITEWSEDLLTTRLPRALLRLVGAR